MNNNVMAATNSELGVTTHTPDTTAPQVASFQLNVNTGKLTIKFDEPVDASTFSAVQACLQNERVAP